MWIIVALFKLVHSQIDLPEANIELVTLAVTFLELLSVFIVV
jgi:hypothetical protein